MVNGITKHYNRYQNFCYELPENLEPVICLDSGLYRNDEPLKSALMG